MGVAALALRASRRGVPIRSIGRVGPEVVQKPSAELPGGLVGEEMRTVQDVEDLLILGGLE
jgi:hypothetical protein